jgi:hypothetical protein
MHTAAAARALLSTSAILASLSCTSPFKCLICSCAASARSCADDSAVEASLCLSAYRCWLPRACMRAWRAASATSRQYCKTTLPLCCSLAPGPARPRDLLSSPQPLLHAALSTLSQNWRCRSRDAASPAGRHTPHSASSWLLRVRKDKPHHIYLPVAFPFQSSPQLLLFICQLFPSLVCQSLPPSRVLSIVVVLEVLQLITMPIDTCQLLVRTRTRPFVCFSFGVTLMHTMATLLRLLRHTFNAA